MNISNNKNPNPFLNSNKKKHEKKIESAINNISNNRWTTLVEDEKTKENKNLFMNSNKDNKKKSNFNKPFKKFVNFAEIKQQEEFEKQKKEIEQKKREFNLSEQEEDFPALC
tara:strand:- start:1779 stop:2114 length:336 start_codon:yes stop_codon:yes gene_type:complete